MLAIYFIKNYVIFVKHFNVYTCNPLKYFLMSSICITFSQIISFSKQFRLFVYMSQYVFFPIFL